MEDPHGRDESLNVETTPTPEADEPAPAPDARAAALASLAGYARRVASLAAAGASTTGKAATPVLARAGGAALHAGSAAARWVGGLSWSTRLKAAGFVSSAVLGAVVMSKLAPGRPAARSNTPASPPLAISTPADSPPATPPRPDPIPASNPMLPADDEAATPPLPSIAGGEPLHPDTAGLEGPPPPHIAGAPADPHEPPPPTPIPGESFSLNDSAPLTPDGPTPPPPSTTEFADTAPTPQAPADDPFPIESGPEPLISSEPAAIASTAPDPTTEDVPETPDFGATPAALTERATPVDPAPPATPEAVALGAPSPLDSPETPTIDAAAPSVVPLHTEGPRPDLSAMESTPGLDAAGAVPTPAGLSDLSPAPSASQPSEPITLAPATPSQPAISAGQPAVPLFPEELPTRRTSPEITSDELFAAADREPEDLVAPPSSVGAISHVVRSGENFWTIAKRYYGSGRFYRALWKANQDVAAEVDQLYVGTKLVIPPAERLDRRYIDPPRRPRSETPQTDEPISRSRLDTNAPRDDRAVRATGREPVASDHAPIRTRVHVTRPYETLRSIARKELGDSRRAAELLELNADLVDDPNHLPVGIPLRVPDDR